MLNKDTIKNSRNSEFLTKTMIIGFATFLSKAFVLVLPFLLIPVEYNEFNTIYYPLSLIIIIAGFGFEFSYPHCNISLLKLLTAVTVNVTIVASALILTGVLNTDPVTVILIILAAVAGISVSVTSFHMLFHGNIKSYGILQITFHGVIIVLFPVINQFEGSPFFFYVLLKTAAALIVFLLIKNNLKRRGNEILKLYTFGFNAMVINGLFTVILSINHILAVKLFSVDSGNNIILSWIFAIPLLYLSGIFEKVLYNSNDLREKIINWSTWNLSLMIFYTLGLVVFMNWFGNFLPASADTTLLARFIPVILPAIFLYSIFNALLNAYVFRTLDYKYQSRIVAGYLGILLIFLSLAILMGNKIILISEIELTIFSTIAIMLSILVKSVFSIQYFRKN
ncbi:MAG: hypothetical protein K9I69_04850 [Ignavibacteriales bacterium]|nr:hypothetical protein [Ignavibacteriales bacterium]MCF8315077.1 hypothetical protein [Ignavibacteriales bacterium]MCF8435927.1 hypothetical protein [Ignavibacteriales bacterium]